jgi:hypothetical protein
MTTLVEISTEQLESGQAPGVPRSVIGHLRDGADYCSHNASGVEVTRWTLSPEARALVEATPAPSKGDGFRTARAARQAVL